MGERKSYSKISEVMEIPNLLSVQLDSFRNFLQADTTPAQRKEEGLQRVFKEVFPISDARDNYSLEFVSYVLGEPKYTIEECQERDVTFAAPLKATLRLIVKENVDGRKEVKDIIELKRDITDIVENTGNPPGRTVALYKGGMEYQGVSDDLHTFLLEDHRFVKVGRKNYEVIVQVVVETPDGIYDFIPILPELKDELP